MSGLGRRLAAEREVWQAVWKQVEAFLDRVQSASDEDKTPATTMCALLPVFNVVERARQRSSGYRLAAALSATPGGMTNGVLVGTVDGAGLKSSARIPGVEDIELAVGSYAATNLDDDGKLPEFPLSFLSRSTKLATFRDHKHGTITLRAPTYDFGDLTGAGMVIVDVGDGGLFPKDQREAATNGEEFQFVKWSDLRTQRLNAAKAKEGAVTTSLSARLAALEIPDEDGLVPPIGNDARSFAQQSREDIDTLDRAKTKLVEVGADDELLGAIARTGTTLHEQAMAFDKLANEIAANSNPGHRTIQDWIDLARAAEGSLAISGLPVAIDDVDRPAAIAMNEAIEQRIGYPDGPLRQLRMLELGLRFYWDHRRFWMNWRDKVVLQRLFPPYLQHFTRSLERVLAGQRSEIPLPETTKVGKQFLVNATEIPLSNLPDLTALSAGQIVIVGGERKTAAPVIDVLIDGKKLPPIRLKVPPLAVSVAAGKNVPGTPGLVPVATPLTDHHRRLDDAELLRGAHRGGPADDAYVQSLIAHRSRLALVLGDAGVVTIPRPYASKHRFDLEGPVTSGDNRLFLTQLPPASSSGTGEQLPLASPGEYLLLFATDADGQAWETAIEVDRVVVATGAEAKRDEAAGATPVPPCCADDDRVMVVYLRSMYLPSDVGELHGAFLHRSFAGFGPRSLLTRVMLPEDLDPATKSTIQVGPQALAARRDPELEVACRVFDDWLPKERS
jgi:hypothetical protein